MRRIYIDDHTERGNDIQLELMEIVTDGSKPDKIEIYLLDTEGNRLEGGTFSKDAFMQVVREFYDLNY
jgi:hypothetical protein